MSNLAMCRVCLTSNTKMHHIANTPYQDILEKLAPELCTADGRPETVCWVCLSVLRRGRRLADTVQAANEILMQLSLSGIQLSEDTVSMLDQKLLCKIAWTPIQTLSIDKEFLHAPIKVEIKEDPSENEEIGLISEGEQINCILNKDESITVKNEEILCENTSIGENEDHSDVVIENEEQTDDICDNKQSASDISGNYQTTIQATIDENEKHIKKDTNNGEQAGNISENEQGASDLSGIYQTTDIGSVNEPKNKVGKTYGNRSKSKRSTEVIVKDQKGLDCVRHICQTCDKTYKQRSHLLRHSKTHSIAGQPPKDVICEKCGKGFANNYTLKKHLLAHQDIRNFTCTHCSIKLSQKSDLVRHMRIHTGEKPFKCDTCDKQYSQKAMLVRHMIIHTGETPYSCERCGLNFNRHSSMVRHLKRMHFSSDKRRYKGQRRPYL